MTSCFSASLLLLCVIGFASASSSPSTFGRSGYSVSWQSPSEGEVYAPGDAILAQWNAQNEIVSPSFRMCFTQPSSPSSPQSRTLDNSDDGDDDTKSKDNDEQESDDNGEGDEDAGSTSKAGQVAGSKQAANPCGEVVAPAVSTTSGSYFVSLAVPQTQDRSSVRLQMIDKYGDAVLSPSFGLSSQALAANFTGLPSSVPASTAAPSSTGTSTANPYSSDLETTSKGPPAISYGLPLGLTGAVLLIAFTIMIRNHHKREKERLARRRDLETLCAAKSQNSFVTDYNPPIPPSMSEKTLAASTSTRSMKTAQPPTTQEPRQSTRQPFGTAPSQYEQSLRTQDRYKERLRGPRPIRNPGHQIGMVPSQSMATLGSSWSFHEPSPIQRTTTSATSSTSSSSSATAVISQYYTDHPDVPQPERAHTREEADFVPVDLDYKEKQERDSKSWPAQPVEQRTQTQQLYDMVTRFTGGGGQSS